MCQTGFEFMSPFHAHSLVLCSQCRSIYVVQRRLNIIGQETIDLKPMDVPDHQKKMMIEQLEQNGFQVGRSMPDKIYERKAGMSNLDAAKLKIAISQAETVQQFLDSLKQKNETKEE